MSTPALSHSKLANQSSSLLAKLAGNSLIKLTTPQQPCILYKLEVASCLCHNKTPDVAPTSFFSKDADWSGYNWTGLKQFRLELLEMDLRECGMHCKHIKEI